MTQTLPAWLPAVIAGGLYAAAIDWRDARRLKPAQDTTPSDPHAQPPKRS